MHKNKIKMKLTLQPECYSTHAQKGGVAWQTSKSTVQECWALIDILTTVLLLWHRWRQHERLRTIETRAPLPHSDLLKVENVSLPPSPEEGDEIEGGSVEEVWVGIRLFLYSSVAGCRRQPVWPVWLTSVLTTEQKAIPKLYLSAVYSFNLKAGHTDSLGRILMFV